MTASNAHTAFRGWIEGDINALLRSNGFVRRQTTFHRTEEVNKLVLNFQKSRKSTNELVLFTATLGVWNRTIGDFSHNTLDWPAIDDCHWTVRLGELLTPPHDYWWRYDATEREAAASRAEVIELLEEHALPLLKRISSDAELVRLWRSGSGPGLTLLQRLKYLSILLHASGHDEDVPPILEEMHRITVGKPAAAAVEEHVRQLSTR